MEWTDTSTITKMALDTTTWTTNSLDQDKCQDRHTSNNQGKCNKTYKFHNKCNSKFKCLYKPLYLINKWEWIIKLKWVYPITRFSINNNNNFNSSYHHTSSNTMVMALTSFQLWLQPTPTTRAKWESSSMNTLRPWLEKRKPPRSLACSLTFQLLTSRLIFVIIQNFSLRSKKQASS